MTPRDATYPGSPNFGRYFKIGATIAVIVMLLLGAGNVFEWLDAKDVMVVQYPNGALEVYTTPGIKPQWFGHVAKFHKRSQFWFSKVKDQGMKDDQSIKVRFNDAGHANISGSLAWEMPMSREAVLNLYTKYGSQGGIEHQLVRTVVEKAVYMTGPLMSSRESYAERRNDLLGLIEDQISLGVYKTQTQQVKQPDPITGVEKTVSIVQLVKDDTGNMARQDRSPLAEFSIKTFNLSLNSIDYSKEVEDQIKEQQQMTMAVQTAIAEAKKAEQAAITAQKNGEAEAAKARWAQEVVKAREVTAAQQRLAVATLDAQAAEQKKRESILLGEGEAERRKLVMNADGALDKKLDALVKVNGQYADAIKNYTGSWVPSIVMGGGTSVAGSGAQEMIQLLTAKTARDLGLDLNVSGAKKTSQGGQ
jgi:regulator of protease activity HflC (stomatin/prohibitin superfamily)